MSTASENDWNAKLRATPAPADGDAALQTHDHAVIVYWHSQEYLDAVVPYIIEGLQAGDRVVHVAHEEPIPPLIDALEAAGVDVQAAMADGQLTVMTAEQAFFPDGRFDIERALSAVQSLAEVARAEGVPQVRFSVDLSYLLAKVPGMEDGPAFEARANDEVFERYPFVCICAYNASRGTTEVVEDIFATHPVVFVRGLPLNNPYFKPWKQLSAEGAQLDRWKRQYAAAAVDG
jgi:hypothetical protein